MSPDVSRHVPAALKGVALVVLLLLGRKAGPPGHSAAATGGANGRRLLRARFDRHVGSHRVAGPSLLHVLGYTDTFHVPLQYSVKAARTGSQSARASSCAFVSPYAEQFVEEIVALTRRRFPGVRSSNGRRRCPDRIEQPAEAG